MLGRVARTTLARHVPMLHGKRGMAGGGDVYVIAGREFGTVEVVLGVMGFYGALIFLGTRGGSKKEAPAAAPAAASTSSSTEVVSVFDEAFEAWSKIPGNMEKWEKSLTEA